MYGDNLRIYFFFTIEAVSWEQKVKDNTEAIVTSQLRSLLIAQHVLPNYMQVSKKILFHKSNN